MRSCHPSVRPRRQVSQNLYIHLNSQLTLLLTPQLLASIMPATYSAEDRQSAGSLQEKFAEDAEKNGKRFLFNFLICVKIP